MWLQRTGVVCALSGLLWSGTALAEAPWATPALAQATRSGWLRFQVVSGHISIGGSRLGHISANPISSRGSEKLNIRVIDGLPSASYELSTSTDRFSVEISAGDRIRIRRGSKEDATVVPVQFTQAPDQPASLALGPDGRQQVYRAASLWHLLIAQPEECRQHLIPLLELLRPGWRLAETAAAIEAELLRMAAVGQFPDRRRWEALVEQLADERFAKREAADRQLRRSGQAVLSYLRELDFGRLDAEQQYRIRRIIRSLSQQSTEDSAERFAPRLLGDADVWLALLRRQEESTRRLAAGQLAAILGEPIAFDSAADPALREIQIEQLRERIQGSGSGAED